MDLQNSPEINYKPSGVPGGPPSPDYALEIENRKNLRDDVQKRVEVRLNELQDLGLNQSDPDQIEAAQIHNRLFQNKQANPTASYFKLINNEILNFADIPDAQNLLVVRKLID